MQLVIHPTTDLCAINLPNLQIKDRGTYLGKVRVAQANGHGGERRAH